MVVKPSEMFIWRLWMNFNDLYFSWFLNFFQIFFKDFSEDIELEKNFEIEFFQKVLYNITRHVLMLLKLEINEIEAFFMDNSMILIGDKKTWFFIFKIGLFHKFPDFLDSIFEFKTIFKKKHIFFQNSKKIWWQIYQN